MNELDDIIKQTVRKLEDTRQHMENNHLEGKVLMDTDAGFPLMVNCPVHGEMLTAVNAATWMERTTTATQERVYYCLKCFKEHQHREMMETIKKVAKKCTVVDAGNRRTDVVVRPHTTYDSRDVSKNAIRLAKADKKSSR